MDRLKKWEVTQSDEEAERAANEVMAESTERAANFSFTKCGIAPGEKIEYINDLEIQATVLDDRNVEYNGEKCSLSALARLLSGKNSAVAGPRFFTYKGEPLNTIRMRLGV